MNSICQTMKYCSKNEWLSTPNDRNTHKNNSEFHQSLEHLLNTCHVRVEIITSIM